jgi:Ala-tRNA(Pro) deacylase
VADRTTDGDADSNVTVVPVRRLFVVRTMHGSAQNCWHTAYVRLYYLVEHYRPQFGYPDSTVSKAISRLFHIYIYSNTLLNGSNYYYPTKKVGMIMAVSIRLKKYLDDNHVKYTVMKHPRAITAQEIAAGLHVPGHEMAKSIMIKYDGEYAMVVLPASYKISFDNLNSFLHSESTELASEDAFKNLFPDCEVGAMSPFGNLYDLPVYMAKSLEKDEDIVFNAGTHTDAIKMKLGDFRKLAHPMVGKISEHL